MFHGRLTRSFFSLWLLALLIPTLSTAAPPLHRWSALYGDIALQRGVAAATDPGGNLLVTGFVQGTTNFGGGGLTSAGTNDVVIAKFSPLGVHQWSKIFGDANSQAPTGIASDASSNVYVVGTFRGGINFGGGVMTSAGDEDIFVAKLNPSGGFLWNKRFGDASFQYCSDVVIDAAGNVIITGRFRGTVNFGGSNLTAPLGNTDDYVAKFDGNGTHLWSVRMPSKQAFHNYLAVDGSGNIYLHGTFMTSIDLGGGPMASMGDWDIFLARFDASGVHQWSQRFGDATPQVASGIASDNAGSLYVVGRFGGTTNLGGPPLVAPDDLNIYVAKFNSSGTHQWSHGYGDAAEQIGSAVTLDAAGNPWFSGYFDGSIDLGGGVLTTAGTYDLFVAQFDPSGNHICSGRYGDLEIQWGTGMAANQFGDVFMTGSIYDSVDFGGGWLSSSGDEDFFIADFGSTVTAIGDTPARAALSISCYPNPFNPETTITYTLPANGRATIVVYDAKGASVNTLFDGEQQAGTHVVQWSGLDAAGYRAGSGVYFTRVVFGALTRSFKIVLLK